MPSTNYEPTVADTIWSQVSLDTKIACGARSPMADGNTLTFGVMSGKTYLIEVTLDPSDTYTVRYLKVNRKTIGYSVVEEVSDVYAESLSRVIYSMVNK